MDLITTLTLRCAMAPLVDGAAARLVDHAAVPAGGHANVSSTTPLAPALTVGPDEPALRDMTLGDLLAWAAMTRPDRTALVAGHPDPAQRCSWTYAELYTQSLRVAHALHARFQPGERVALWAPNSAEWVMLEFGAAMAGVVLVAIHADADAAELERVLKHCAAAAVVVGTSHRGQDMVATVQALAPRCRSLRELVRLERWQAFVASGDVHAHTVLPAMKCDDVVMLQYTAGTTGAAKAARLHHLGLVNNAAHTAQRLGLGDGDVWVGAAALSQAAGCVLTVLGAVSRRATLVLAQELDAALVLELVASYGGNAVLAAPELVQSMLEHALVSTTELSSLRVLAAAGTRVPAALVTRCRTQWALPLHSVYGLSEAAPSCLMTSAVDATSTAAAAADGRADMLGTPLPGVQVRLCLPDTTHVVSAGELGEICVRGYHLMRGYHEPDVGGDDAVDSGGWLRTGDLARMDEHGVLSFAGRLSDHMARGVGGVCAHELEDVLCRHPQISEAAVLGLSDAAGGEALAAFICPRGEALLRKDELHRHVRKHLAVHQTPRHWFLVHRLPSSSLGKVQKYKLREHFNQGVLVALS